MTSATNLTEDFKEVEVEFSDETFIKIAKLAHDKDVTFNKMCSDILSSYMNKEENKPQLLNEDKK